VIAALKQRIAARTPAWAVQLLGAINGVRYHGSRLRCPICRRDLARFLPLPRQYRVDLHVRGRRYGVSSFETLMLSDYLCPVCRSADRDRLMALYLQRAAQSGELRGRLLHFAPEPSLSRYLRSLLPLGYRSVDLFMHDVDEKADITRLVNFADSSVDHFVCSHVLEHVPDDRQAMRELFRILRPGGWGIVLTPILRGLDESYEDPSVTTPEQRLFHFGQDDHVRVYAKRDFILRLEGAGFRVEALGKAHFGPEQMKRSGITEDSVLYVVHK
jgi:hypothetical protein